MKHFLFVCACLASWSFAQAEPATCPACPVCEKCEPAAQAKKEEISVAQTNDIQEVAAFLKAQKTYYIATVEGDQPRVRPFGTAHLFEGKLYIQSGKKKAFAKQIAANPKVEIVSYDGKGVWMRIAATLVEDSRVEAQESMLAAYPELQKMYKAGDGNTVVYYLKDAKATISSFAAPAREITF